MSIRCLRDYQENAIEKSNGKPGFAYAHDMGTGKSFTAIKELCDRNARIVLISCPKSVMSVWPSEFAKFRNLFPEVYIDYKIIVLDDAGVENKSKYLISEVKKAGQKKQPIVVVINYDSIWRAPLGMTLNGKKIVSLGVIGMISWQVHIMDEIHRIKDPKSKASTYCYHLNKKIPLRRGLSGTIMPHSPLDIYGVFRALDSSIFGISFFHFKAKYAKFKDIGGFKKFIGMNNTDEFNSILNKYADIIKSEDVLTLLPTTHETRYVHLGLKARKIYDELEKKFFAEVEAEQISGQISVETALVKMLRLNQITGGAIAIDGHDGVSQIDTAKMDALSDLLEDLPQDEPFIVFTRFRHECEYVRRVFEKHKRRHGELSGSCNDLQAFMNGEIDCMAVNIRSGGVGVNFTRARYCAYINTGLSLGDFEQSLKRTDRYGQDRNVFYYHFIAIDTIDEKIYESLRNKKNVVSSVIEAVQEMAASGKRNFSCNDIYAA